eukprot:SAG31_NODE_35780_length_320_cov_0.606335_1_plen_61_part_10
METPRQRRTNKTHGKQNHTKTKTYNKKTKRKYLRDSAPITPRFPTLELTPPDSSDTEPERP